jgi:hypothetical protein
MARHILSPVCNVLVEIKWKYRYSSNETSENLTPIGEYFKVIFSTASYE